MNPQHHKNVMDPFQCNCSVCVMFWKKVFGSSADVIFDSYDRRMQDSSDLGIRIHDMIRKGDRVDVHGKAGIVKFVGFVDDNLIAPKIHIGVKLDDNVLSLTNGVYEGKRYFYCTQGHGIMVPYSEVKRIRPYVKTPRLTNSMFPSWQQVRTARKERQEKLEAFYRSRSSSSSKLCDNQRTCNISQPLRTSSESRPRIVNTDQKDMVYKDSIRYQQDSEKREKNERIRTERSIKEEKKILMRLFGSGKRADKLGETLKYLQRGYEKGQEEKLKSLRYHVSYSDEYEE